MSSPQPPQSGGRNVRAGRGEENPLEPSSLAAISCATEIAGRRIARHLAAVLPGPLEKQGMLAVVTATAMGAAVLAAVRQLGNLQFPVSGIVLGTLDYVAEPLREEIKRCRAFRIPLRECQNERDLEFVLQFAGLRLVAVDLQEDVTRHSELRDGLLEHPCIDLWSVREPVADSPADATAPWYRLQHLPGWATVGHETGSPPTAEFQPLLTVSDLGAPSAPQALDCSRDMQIDAHLARHWTPLTRYFSPPSVSRETCRLLDSRAIREFHMTGLRMMELAAFQAAEIAALMARPRVQSADHRVAVICGLGNNGGDGFVLARYLASWGFPTDVYIVGDRMRILDDALLNLRRLERLRETIAGAAHELASLAAGGTVSGSAQAGSEWRQAAIGDLITPGWTRSGPTRAFVPLPDVAAGLELVPVADAAALAENAIALQHSVLLVDALLGTGMHGEVRGLNRDAIAWINAAARPGNSTTQVPTLALDTPSGIDASTGAVLGLAVQADVTVTFGAPKIGLSPSAPSPEGPRHAGKVILAEISWPPSRNRGW